MTSGCGYTVHRYCDRKGFGGVFPTCATGMVSSRVLVPRVFHHHQPPPGPISLTSLTYMCRYLWLMSIPSLSSVQYKVSTREGGRAQYDAQPAPEPNEKPSAGQGLLECNAQRGRPKHTLVLSNKVHNPRLGWHFHPKPGAKTP